jgi:hypothetical protein
MGETVSVRKGVPRCSLPVRSWLGACLCLLASFIAACPVAFLATARAQTHRQAPVSTAVRSIGLRTAASSPATRARLTAAFKPNRLGHRTTLQFGFSFSAPAGQVPPPLTEVELRYPNQLGIGLSGLGFDTCTLSVLEASGPHGCPPNSVMGYGVVLTGIVLGTTIISEQAPITILRAPDHSGSIALLFYSEGTKPVATTIVFGGLLVPAPVPFGGQVNIGVPLVPTLPGAPYISVIKLHATIGPEKVTYFERVSGQTLAYRPKGILLPPKCPRGGMPFSARFSFLDKSEASAATAVPCHGLEQRRNKHRHSSPVGERARRT